ncbi:AraC family transcriptional regulator [Paenibacillus sacheonensis]|uniref:Helix-turn-helix domain-containing protein n=1 Tax=Paenibacillus sacheonensis TaxID=742054 RepID=A0A7X5C2Y0_9BACL|nr:AraC family transcriptional regulator [Paenibacillus sacheonensis]MBM7569229.1 AraC-like DNA-binding protein [Paenibacillus sacheonensis]NBC71760.1 helix-turn-helix domain-containing protein [Paenibacillus sacheonensis]
MAIKSIMRVKLMSLFPTLRSKRYLQRILLSVTLLTVILLLVTAFSIMYTSERTVLSVQQSANEKVLSQIRYNVAQMNEIVADTAQTLYQNNDVKILRYSKTDDELMYQRITALDTFVGTSSFLHSIFVYNGHMDRFYVGNGNIRAVKDPYEKKFRSLISDSRGTPKLRLIPVDLDDTGTGSRKVDFFSYILFDPSSTQGLDDALILNIKSAWLFDNLDLIAREDGERTGNAYLMDGTGQILNADSEQERGISELAERLRPALGSGQSSGYEVMRIGGTKEVISFMKAGVQDWTLVHTQPYAEVVSQVQRLRYTTALLTILFLALAVAVAVMISKRLYRPFEQLFSSVVSNAPGEMVRGESIRDEMAFLSGLYGNLVDRVKLADSSIAENRWILKRFTLRQLVQESGLRTPAQWEKEARENGLAIDASGGYTLCVARIDDAASLAQRGDPGEQRLFHYAISNISEEIISEAFSIEVVDLKPDHLVFLIQRRGEGSERLIAMLGEIQQIVKQYYRLTFSVAVSDTLEDSRELSSLYAKTLNQSVYKLFYGRGSIITAGMVAEHERAGDLTIPSDLERRLAEGIRSASREMLDASLDRFFELLRVMPYDNCLHALSYLSIVIKRTVSEVNGNKLKPISTDLYRLHSVVLEQETLDDTKDVFRQLLHELCASRQEERDADRNDFMIETIKEIVQANYKDLNLSLQSVSELLKMSSVYVGRLFKKAEGKSLADYINEVRLQQTMLLLEKGDFTINEIMEAAGFSNQSHFFRLFKKKFGTTPREYRMKKMLS